MEKPPARNRTMTKNTAEGEGTMSLRRHGGDDNAYLEGKSMKKARRERREKHIEK